MNKSTDRDVIWVSYCELCREWVEDPNLVCEYKGRAGFITLTSEGWPDRKPVKSNIHKLSEAIKALQYYAEEANSEYCSSYIAVDVLKKIKEQDDE